MSDRWADEPTIAESLLSVDPRSVPFFTFAGYSCDALVTQVMNGDTCTVLFPFGETLNRITVRLRGVAAEATGTEWLRKRTKGRPLKVLFDRYEKSGKPLVTLYDDDDDETSINETMIREGVGKPFGVNKK